jgi:hypothetical protein
MRAALLFRLEQEQTLEQEHTLGNVTPV